MVQIHFSFERHKIQLHAIQVQKVENVQIIDLNGGQIVSFYRFLKSTSKNTFLLDFQLLCE